MNSNTVKLGAAAAVGCALYLLTGCQHFKATVPAKAVTIASHGANVVSVWNEIAAKTINVAPSAVGTAEERQPHYALDLATVHVAIYDAVVAVTGTHKPYAIAPATVGANASADAAANAAAFGVLKGLFPARADVYLGTHDTLLADIPDGDAKSRGSMIGAEVARAILVLRANDGRAAPMAPYVPGTAPGEFRGVSPLFRSFPNVRPFTITAAAPFRPSGPPSLSSSAYAADFNETKAFGAANSTVRNAVQTEVARFHSEPPWHAWPRNLHQFATSNRSLADNARLMAMLWVAHADAVIACFDSKYYFEFWRPTSAIALADTDTNTATVVDANWTPVVPTPNHPEYPAAHSCSSGATAEVLRYFFGTVHVSFKFDSTVKNTIVHSYTTTDELVADVQAARIHGGMHFRTATEHGAALGAKVARWVTTHHFQKRE